MSCTHVEHGLRASEDAYFPELDEEETRRLAGRLWTLMEHGPVATMLKDRQGRCLYANGLLERIVGTTDWLGKDEFELFAPEKAKRIREASGETLRTGKSNSIVLPCVFSDATTRWWKVVCFPTHCPDGELLVGVMAVDVSDQRRMEEEVLDISDREHRRMARELHDGLCQHLVGLRMMSQTLQDALEREESPHLEKARSITSFLASGVDLARELIRDYHLQSIEEKGLVPALEEFSRNAGQLFGVPVNVSIRDSVAIPRQDVAMQIFRIVQEAVHNSLKHADPSQVDIVMETGDESLILEVRDDGRGFPPQDRLTRGLGLNTMLYRADSINGQLHIGAGKNKGALVRCVIPLESLGSVPWK